MPRACPRRVVLGAMTGGAGGAWRGSCTAARCWKMGSRRALLSGLRHSASESTASHGGPSAAMAGVARWARMGARRAEAGTNSGAAAEGLEEGLPRTGEAGGEPWPPWGAPAPRGASPARDTRGDFGLSGSVGTVTVSLPPPGAVAVAVAPR